MAYDNWAAFEAAVPTTQYAFEVEDLRTQHAVLAIHGDELERLTDDVVRDVAVPNRNTKYALLLHKDPQGQPADIQSLRITAPNFDEPQCVALQANASYTTSFHAFSDRGTDNGAVRVQGLDTVRRDRLTEVLRAADFTVVNNSEEGAATAGDNGDARDPENIVNKNRNKAGVNIEMDRTLRNSFLSDPANWDSPKTAKYNAFIKAIADYFGTYERYNRWQDLEAMHPEGGGDWTTEQATPASPWAHLAIHGGGIELGTSTVAKQAAIEGGQKFWVFNALMDPASDLDISADRFNNPEALTLLNSVRSCVVYHGIGDSSVADGDTPETIYVGGLDEIANGKIIDELTSRGFTVKQSGEEKSHNNAADPDNICNRTRTGKGTQISLTRTTRNSFFASGDAADESQGTTQAFTDFIEGIKAATFQEIPPAAERPFDVTEPGSSVFGGNTTVALQDDNVMQQAIQDDVTGDVFATQVPSGSGHAAAGDLVISRVAETDGTWALADHMFIDKADHGSSLSGIENVDGTIYLWLGVAAKAGTGGANGHATRVGRLKYQAGTRVDGTVEGPQLKIYNPVPDPDLEYIAPGLDFVNNRMWVYHQKGGQHFYTPYDFNDFKAGDYTKPLWPTIGPIKSPTGSIRQNFCVFGDWIYQFHGNGYSDNNPPPPVGVGNAYLLIINARTGEIVEQHIRNTEPDYEYREPEAINIWTPVANPRLMYGWAVGASGDRKMHLRTISSRWAYRNWADLQANAVEGTDYTVHYRPGMSAAVAPNAVSQIAIHGDRQELFTMKIAEAVSDKTKNQFFAVEGMKGGTPPDSNALLRIPSPKFDEPQAVQMQQSCEYSFSYHGRANDTDDPEGGIVRIGGLDRVNGARIINELINCGITAEYGGREGGGWGDHLDPLNIVNRNINGSGVQMELSRALRDRMSTTGDAGDEDAELNELGQCFVNTVSAIALDPRDQDEQEDAEERCIRYFINDYELNQPQRGIKLMQGTEWASSISPRRFDLEIPQWHGQLAMWHDPLDTMKVTFEVEIQARTQSMLRQRYNDFVSLCGTGKWIPVRLERYRGIFLMSDTEHDFADTNRPYGEYANAQLESLSAPEYEHAGMRLTTTCVFNVPVGQWRTHKEYTQAFTQRGGPFRCVVAKTSSVPVYSMIIRVQGGPGGQRNLAAWSLVDRWSQTGVAWDDPIGINLNNGEYLYCNTDNMRCYISGEKSMPEPGESWGDFIGRIDGQAAWSNFRYIRNGPLMLTHKLEWNEELQALTHTSGVNINMTAIDGEGVDRELVIQARAANR